MPLTSIASVRRAGILPVSARVRDGASLAFMVLACSLAVQSLSCAPGWLPDLSFDAAGGPVRLRQEKTGMAVSKAETGDRLWSGNGSVLTLVPERHVDVPVGTDLVVTVRGRGRVSITATDGSGKPDAFVSATFELPAGATVSLHLAPGPDVRTIGSVSLESGSAGAAQTIARSVTDGGTNGSSRSASAAGSGGETGFEILGIGLAGGIRGFEIRAGIPHMDNSVISLEMAGDEVVAVRLAVHPSMRDGSLMLDSSGTVSITSSGNGQEHAGTTVRAAGTVSIPAPRLGTSGAVQGLAVPLAALGQPPSVEARTADGALQSVLFLHGGGAPLADLHVAMHAGWPVSLHTGPAYRLYRWDVLPETLIFDFSDYAVQDRYLKRLAFFVEKPGFRGRLAGNEEIEDLHGWNAHDYAPRTLAAFYELARVSGFVLNPEETELLGLLLRYGIVGQSSSGTYGPGQGAIISATRESTRSLRRLFFDHEASHAVYFQDAGYRRLAADLWNAMSPVELRFWMVHLAWRRYDTTDIDLCINEMQAYLIQQPVASIPAYYRGVAGRLAQAYPDRADQIRADVEESLPALVRSATVLGDYLAGTYGLGAGNFGRAEPVD